MDNIDVVKLRNVSYIYKGDVDKAKILDNVSITVPAGVIYALLGPSGCGKTTLLRTVTGSIKLKPDQGDVTVFGRKPASEGSYVPGPGIGFMPQDLSLNGVLTTKETLLLYGRLNGINSALLPEKIEKLCKLLEIPVKSSIIDNLSGGQQRRVSLATALLHHPPLLILDEPTVGLDPLLRKKIWAYLVELTVKYNTTIIITTHYIEEARDAHMMAAMRKGRILAETTPMVVMSYFKDYNLESCFTRLCYMDSNKTRELFDVNTKNENDDGSGSSRELTSTDEAIAADNYFRRPSMKPVFHIPNFGDRCRALCRRNITLMRRHRALLSFQISVPLVQIVLYCICVTNDLFDLPTAIANDEGPNKWGQQFINSIDRVIVQERKYDFDSGYRSVELGHTFLLVHMGENFTECFEQRIIDGLDAENETVQCSSISLYFDLSNKQIYQRLFRHLLQAFQKFFRGILIDLKKTPMIARWPLDMDDTLYGTYDGDFAEFLLPGVIIIISHYMAVAVSILKLIKEKKVGTEEKLWTCGVTQTDLLCSHFITDITIVIFQAVIVLSLAYYVFLLPLHGSIFTVGLVTISQGLVGLSFGLFISTMFEDDVAALYLAIGIMFANLLTSGIIWPIEGIPQPLRGISYYLPLTMSAEAIKTIMSKGSGFSHRTVQMGFVSAFTWLAIFLGFAIIILRLKK